VDQSKPTAATLSYVPYLTFEPEQTNSPTNRVASSNQNALLSIMSRDDLEGIKVQIHERLNQSREQQSVRLKSRRGTVL
jgi:hypothetical protein